MKRTITEGYTLSPQQERAWRLERGGVPLSGVRAVMSLRGPLKPRSLARALDEVINRHEILRTTIAHPPGLDAPLQFIDEEPRPFAWDADETGAGEPGPVRAELSRIGPDHHTLRLALPATHGDAASVRIIAADLAESYAEILGLAGAGAGKDKPPQYADAAEWQITCLKSAAHAGDRAYWANLAAHQAQPGFPFAHSNGAEPPWRPERTLIQIDEELSDALIALAARYQAPLGDLLQTAWLALAWRLGAADMLAALHDGRRHKEARALVGPLSKYLPQRYAVSSGMKIADLLREVSRANAESRLREEYYAWQQPNASRIPAFEFIDCSYRLTAGPLTIELCDLDVTLDRFQIKLSAAQRRAGLSAALCYDGSVFDSRDIEMIASCFRTALSGMAADPDSQVGTLPIVSPAEAEREIALSCGPALARTVGDGAIESPERMFEACVAEDPTQTAVVWKGGSLSYGQLNAKANQLANLLIRHGASTERLVAVMLQNVENAPLAFLASLKAGAAYVPLDPSYPIDRLTNLLAAVQADIVIVDGNARILDAIRGRTVIDLSAVDLSSEDPENLNIDAPPDALAYVMYTSGSTGSPKGVMVTRANLSHSTRARRDLYGRWARFVLLSPYIFDSSAAGIYGSLCGGGALLSPPQEARMDTRRLLEFITQREATHMLMVPSFYSALLAEPSFEEHRPTSLKGVIVAGEACPRDLVERHVELLPGVPMYNEYGPTEATVWATCARVDQAGAGFAHADSPSIGYPIAGSRVLLLDASLQPAPVGVVGEIFIGGPGVARGYINQPGKTAAVFVPCPWKAGERLYRTGDLARRAPDGSLFFVGRRDDQIKINGYRIEPGEIEAAIRSVQGVSAAVVVAPVIGNGTRTLVACVETGAALEPQALRQALRRTLPEQMIPHRFVTTPALPRTATGKIDRAACTAMADEILSQHGGRPPQTPLEIELAAIWRDLLNVDTLNATEDFFTLGGHSLLAIQLLARVRDKFGCEIKLDQLFQAPTIEALARTISQTHGGEPTGLELAEITPDPAARYEPFPLNSIQEAYWVGRKEGFELGNVGSTNYFEFDAPGLDMDRFATALQALIKRHDMLRATIHADGFQQVAERTPPYVIKTIDARGMSPEQAQRSIEQVRARMSVQSLRTDRWPLFDIVAHLLPSSTRLHISTELVVCDAVSSRILLRDLYRLYHEPEVELPPLELQFRDYVMAERALRKGPRFERAKAYWLDKLASLPPAPELPLAKDPRQVSAPHFSTLKHELSEAMWNDLKRRAAESGVTATAVLCAAYASVLSIWTKTPHFTLNLTTYNRLPFHPQAPDLVGDFTSLTMLEVDCRDESFTERVRRMQHEIWQNLDHGEFGGVDVVRELRRMHGIGSRALMPVVFTSQLGTAGRDDPKARRWIGDLVYSTGQAPQVWIDHQVAEPEGRLQFWWDYLEELFPPGLVEQIFDRYRRFLADLASNDELWTSAALDMWSAPSSVAASVNAEAAETTEQEDLSLFPGNVIHGGFLLQARRQPSAPAVIWESDGGSIERLSYDELREWARRIAAWAREKQPGGDRDIPTVAVLLPKGWAQVAAALGVTWAGAAYLPMDQSWPAGRIAEVLSQTGCKLLISERKTRSELGVGENLQWLCIDEWIEGGESPADAVTRWRAERPAQAADAEDLLPGAADPDGLAYVIYTSGSTGKPKGVMIEHRAACVTLAEIARRWNVGPSDRVLALSALSFDLSVFDIFGMLAAGGAIVLPTESQRRDPAAWMRLAGEQAVTIWNSVPALMEMAVEYVEGRGEAARWPGPLRLALLSGDWIPVSLPGKVRARVDGVSVVSLGGATEASIWSIAYEVDQPDEVVAQWRSVPYGKALAGQTVEVLRGGDEPGARNLTPCAPWVTGRIYIGGRGLARGYWGNPEETQRRFITNLRTGERLYDTGDLGRLLPDGNIELLGRVDQQVKLRGYRVELGEIEATLRRHPALSAAAVKLVETVPGAGKQLVAYVVPRDYASDAGETASADPDARPFNSQGAQPVETAATSVRAANERWMKALQFKLDRPGLRPLPEGTPDAPLPSAAAEGPSFARSLFQSRRTIRYFDTNNPVTADRLGRWLECLRETRDGKTYHREYPSAGSLYPVQTYLWVKPGGVSGLASGLYYYDPIRHRLALINRNLTLARELYDSINYSVFDRSGFALFLIGKLSAIAPLYDQAARDFCLIEAGCMTQLLMVEAVAHSIGLCPIGGLAFDRIREGFEIDEQHVLLHSLLGGAAPPRKPREEKEAAAALPAAAPPTPAPSQETTEDALIANVLAFSRETLPEYLVPSRFMVVKRLPLSSNGKIDRSQLPDPPPPGEQASAEPPRTDVEKAVAEIWMDLLQTPQINVGDDFFALGGDSILSIRFLNRVSERFHIELPLREFFGSATLEKVAAMIERLVIARVHDLDEADVQRILSSAE